MSASPIYAANYEVLKASIPLAELALDMRWVRGIMLPMRSGGSLIPNYGNITHNPWVVLQACLAGQVNSVLADPAFRKNVDDLCRSPAAGGGDARTGFKRTIRKLP